jgi:MFS transporter, DHA1 family, multidrug resistance protein
MVESSRALRTTELATRSQARSATLCHNGPVKLSWRGLQYLLFTSVLLEQTGQGHLTAFTPLLLRDMGMTPEEIGVWTGLLYALTMGIALPLAPIWGVLAERYSRRLVVVRSSYLQALAYLLCAFADNLGLLIFARALLGLTYANVAAAMATQSLLTPRKNLGSAIGLVQAAMPIAGSLGPPLGAVLMPVIGLRGLFFMDSIIVLGSAIMLTVLLPEPPGRHKEGPVLGRAADAFRFAWNQPPIRWNLIGGFAARGATSTVDTYLPVRITQVTTEPVAAIGIILGVYGALTAFSTWLVGRMVNRIPAPRLFTSGMLCATLATLGMAFAPNVWVLGLLAILRSAPVATNNTVLFSHLSLSVSREQQTIIMGISPLPRTLGALFFPFCASLVVHLWSGSALLVGALTYGFATFSGRKLGAASTESLLRSEVVEG